MAIQVIVLNAFRIFILTCFYFCYGFVLIISN